MRSFLTFILLLTGLNAFSVNAYHSGGFASGGGYGSSFNSVANLRVDSLRTLLANSLANKDNPTDTLTINRINKLASEFIDINPDSALYYGTLAINKSIAIRYNAGIAGAMLQIGKVQYMKGDYQKSQKNLEGAKLLYLKINDEKGLAESYIELGRMYDRIANYNQAAYYFNQSLEINKRIRNDAGIANSYHNIGMIADNIGKSSSALDNYFKSLSINLKLQDKLSSASNYNNIGEVMKEMEIYPKSMEYYNKAVKIWEDSKNIQGVSTGLENIGEILLLEKKYDEAIVYFNKSMKLTQSQDDKDGLSLLNRDLGVCYANKKEYHAALGYMALSLQIASDYKLDFDRVQAYIGYASVYNQEHDYQNAYKYALLGKALSDKLGSLDIRSRSALELSAALGGLSKFKEAYQMRKIYDDLKDSLKSDENVQKLTSFGLESNFKEKQRVLAAEHQRKDELYQQKIQRQGLLSVIFVVIIIAMVGILIVYYKAKRKQQNINIILEDKNIEVIQQKSDLNEQADKLNELNNLKDRLISVLAHDLRAPLSTLRGLFGLLEDDSISHEQFLTMIPQALKKLEYTSDFLDTLLFWINSQMENFDSSGKSFPLRDVASYEITNYHEQALEKGIKLIDDVSEEITVSADPNSVRIVIRNLITNAIKFSRRDDTIIVSARHQDEHHILLSVKDTGVGMSEKQLNKLFKSKVDSGTGTNNESGTGMGMLFCKDLIEKCNGKIWVESTQGEGTEFFFTLPIGVAKEEEAAYAS